MFIDNGIFKIVPIDWESMEEPVGQIVGETVTEIVLKEGTPLSADGKVANGAAAIGIVPQTTVVKVRDEDILDANTTTIRLLTGGDVFLAEVEEAYGEAISANALGAMKGIRFHLPDGTVYGGSGGSGGGTNFWDTTLVTEQVQGSAWEVSGNTSYASNYSLPVLTPPTGVSYVNVYYSDSDIVDQLIMEEGSDDYTGYITINGDTRVLAALTLSGPPITLMSGLLTIELIGTIESTPPILQVVSKTVNTDLEEAIRYVIDN